MSSFGVSIIIVNYNTKEYIANLLESIRHRISHQPLEIVVIDNGSSDGSVELLESLNFIKLYKQKANISHGPALDFGIRESLYDYLLILDSDTLVLKGTLIEELIQPLVDNPNILAAGPLMYVNSAGINTDASPDAIPYIHPHCCGLNKRVYLNLESGFVSHGAPGIEIYAEAKRKNIKYFAVDNISGLIK
ncbi:MAG: glycosyltransferase, partial [candidate division Zixibacteria bacterium]|nr:glycosyltransferase [candidate division Zixibacteria bacterium]